VAYALEVTSLSPISGSNGEDTSVSVFGTGFESGAEVSFFGVDLFNRSIVGSSDTPNHAYGVYVAGSHAYVADGASGLQVVDVSSPASPSIIGTCDTPGVASGVYVLGSHAYVADSYAGVQVIDVSNPASPQIIGTGYVTGHAVAICASGNHAYVADGSANRLQVIDVSDPTNPSSVGWCDTMSNALGVYVSGNYAYVAANMNVEVIDVSDPANPSTVGTCNTPHQAYDVYVSGNYAYVADGASGLQVVDVSNPASPSIVSSCDTPDEARGIYISGGYAYVADYDAGLHVITGFVSLTDVTWVNDTELTATVPAGLVPGTYNLYVSNPGGESATLNNAFTVTTTTGYTILNSFQGPGPGGLAYEEETDSLWATDFLGYRIVQLNRANGSIMATLDVSYNDRPAGLTIKDAKLYCSDQVNEIIYKIDKTTGNIENTYVGQRGLTFDNDGYLWRGPDSGSTTLQSIDTQTGQVHSTLPLPLDPNKDFIKGLAFDHNTETLWVGYVDDDTWSQPGGPDNFLLHVRLDGAVLSTEEFSPDPNLTGYELCGLAFDDTTNTLWANYSKFEHPPSPPFDTMIYQLAMGEPSGVPVIDKLRRRRREPGQRFHIVGSNFGVGDPGDYVSIGRRKLYFGKTEKAIFW
jgi:hypothetical protein